MVEKRGWTNKSIYDFNTSSLLEVLIGKTWFRVTCEDFRSFDGSRRITHWEKGIKIHTYYYGPIYFHRTNKIATPTNSNKILYVNENLNITPKLKNRDLKNRLWKD